MLSFAFKKVFITLRSLFKLPNDNEKMGYAKCNSPFSR